MRLPFQVRARLVLSHRMELFGIMRFRWFRSRSIGASVCEVAPGIVASIAWTPYP